MNLYSKPLLLPRNVNKSVKLFTCINENMNNHKDFLIIWNSFFMILILRYFCQISIDRNSVSMVLAPSLNLGFCFNLWLTFELEIYFR